MRGVKDKGAVKNTKAGLKPADEGKVGKRKAVADVSSTRKEKNAKKDPNKPKRPPSAFFVFLEDFRSTFKRENPNVKAVSAVGKAAGVEWKLMSAADKAVYEAKAAKRKAEYEKQMNAYNKKQETAGDEESEVNDDDNGVSGEEDEEEEEDDD